MAGNWTRATERTDSEIHSFSDWAIMTRTVERTDSEIHSFSDWAIMTRATERTDNEIHSFSHWAIVTGYSNQCVLMDSSITPSPTMAGIPCTLYGVLSNQTTMLYLIRFQMFWLMSWVAFLSSCRKWDRTRVYDFIVRYLQLSGTHLPHVIILSPFGLYAHSPYHWCSAG